MQTNQEDRGEMNQRIMTITAALTLTTIALTAGNAMAITNGDKCAAAKMKAAAKYASCRIAADAKAKGTGDAADYTKCNDSQAASWEKIEGKYLTDCETSGDQASVQ